MSSSLRVVISEESQNFPSVVISLNSVNDSPGISRHSQSQPIANVVSVSDLPFEAASSLSSVWGISSNLSSPLPNLTRKILNDVPPGCSNDSPAMGLSSPYSSSICFSDHTASSSLSPILFHQPNQYELTLCENQFLIILSKYEHLLTRSLFKYIHSRLEEESSLDTSEGSLRYKLAQYPKLLLRLHGNPSELFLSAFVSELSTSSSLATVMRDSSPSVQILQTIGTFFDLHVGLAVRKCLKIINSNSRFRNFTKGFEKKERRDKGQKMKEEQSGKNAVEQKEPSQQGSAGPKSLGTPTSSPSQNQSLTSLSSARFESSFSFPSPSSSNVRANFMRVIQIVLTADAFPPLISYLTVQCAKYVKSSELGKMESAKGVSLLQWAVASIVFLRFLVPAVTHYASDGSLSDFERKVVVLLGRFLMKLSCQSTFLEYSSSSMVNVLLSDAAPFFDKFCEDISSIGSQIYFPPALSGLEIPGANEVILVEFSDFLKSHCSSISKLCCELSISDAPSSSSSGHSGDIQSLCEDFHELLINL